LSFFNELKRRNVLRVGAAYIVGAWLLIQVAETVFPLFGFNDAPARIVVIVLAIVFVPVLILAWAFELTPKGLKKESEVDRTQSIAPNTGKMLDRVIIVVLALALGYFAFDKFVLTPQRDAEQLAALEEQKTTEVEQARQAGRTEALVESYGEKSIAVLAFQDMSQGKDQEYLSDGIAEELLNLLAKIPELRVISRSSAFSYKGRNVKLAQMAEELNAAHILEGSVRKAGNRVRITVQLVEARSDTHLWSETYDRTLDDIFAIQDEIAAMVVEQLKITLLGVAPTVHETDPEAYALFLQARHLGRQQTAENFEQSIMLYEQALALDPGYAAAWDGLAANYSNQASKGLRPINEGYALAREAAEKALSINPDYALSHGILGWIAMNYDNDLAAAARQYERALALEPTNPHILSNAASMLRNLGRLEQANALNEYVNSRDPVHPQGLAKLGRGYLSAGRWDESIASFQTLLRLSPGYISAHYFIGKALLFKGEPEAALAAMQLEEFEGYRLIGLAMAHHALGQAQASDEALAELIEKYEKDAAFNIAYVLAYRNEADRAFKWLDKAVEYVDSGLPGIVGMPEFSNIQNDPRWLPFLQSIGMSPEQLAAIEFEVKLPD
jgi:adenylate cyclase